MFDEQYLKDIILEFLTPEGKSISALSRDLKENNIDMHKLILTGYLRAMADMGILKEKEVPPSKLYVPVKSKSTDIYELVGNCARSVCSSSEADLLILHTLCRLFKRAVFLDELKKAGIKDTPTVKQAGKEEKLEAKKVLQRTSLKVSETNPAYNFHGSERFQHMYEDVLSLMLSSTLDVNLYTKQTKQTTLFGL